MKYNANVLVYVDGIRDEQQLEQIRSGLSVHTGITRIRAAGKPKHLIVVDYDPSVTTAQGILARVCEHGVGGRLIGL